MRDDPVSLRRDAAFCRLMAGAHAQAPARPAAKRDATGRTADAASAQRYARAAQARLRRAKALEAMP